MKIERRDRLLSGYVLPARKLTYGNLLNSHINSMWHALRLLLFLITTTRLKRLKKMFKVSWLRNIKVRNSHSDLYAFSSCCLLLCQTAPNTLRWGNWWRLSWGTVHLHVLIDWKSKKSTEHFRLREAQPEMYESGQIIRNMGLSLYQPNQKIWN